MRGADPSLGAEALEACDKNLVTDELREVILGIIISTGLVSNFVQVDYTTGLAHAVYNGFTVLPEIEANHHLHGEIVSYGILVLLTVDGQWDERDRLYAFNRSVGLPHMPSGSGCDARRDRKGGGKGAKGDRRESVSLSGNGADDL